MDRQILDHLQTDGRIKLSELGRRVRLRPAAVTERGRRLEAAGVISGYGAHVVPARLGYGIQAFMVGEVWILKVALVTRSTWRTSSKRCPPSAARPRRSC